MNRVFLKAKRFLGFGLALVLSGCAGLTPRPYPSKGLPFVRVRIISDTPVLSVSSSKSLLFKHGSHLLLTLKAHEKAALSVTPTGQCSIQIPGSRMILKTSSVRIESPRGKLISVNGKHYRGAVEITRSPTGNFSVVNDLDLESYVKGVVPMEIGRGRREIFEALKAQAVAARTYAYRRLGEKAVQGSDPLESTVSDQVYGGADAEAPWTNRAVEETKGEILTYLGKPIYAFYSSTCGGRTEPVSDVWPQIHVPYLRGVADNFGRGDFCRASPHYRWMELWTRDELDSLLRAELTAHGKYRASWGQVTNLRVRSRFRSGRIRDLEIDFQHGSTTLHGNSLRWFLKPTGRALLRSTLCRFLVYPGRSGLEAVLVVGAGNGHGVGMCQWGAMGMAEAGYSYRQILGHYYRGARLKQLY